MIWQLLAALVLFAVGLRLSAFFSGSETGFYRASFLRVSIEAHSGDARSKRLMWFAENPSYFVATTLVGNNVANYLTTASISLAVACLFAGRTDWVDVAATLLFSPIIFVFGELVPKNLYYRAPLILLKQRIGWFWMFYRVFLPVSFPLIGITRLFERFSSAENRQLVLGRSRLAQVFIRGRQEGILTDVQNRLVHGLLYTSDRPVAESMTPSQRVHGVVETASRDEVLNYARRLGISSVAVRSTAGPDCWFGYWRVVDLAVSGKPLNSLLRIMPIVAPTTSKLEGLLTLRTAGEQHAAVTDKDGTVVGVVNEHELVEQLFRPARAVAAVPVRSAAPAT